MKREEYTLTDLVKELDRMEPLRVRRVTKFVAGHGSLHVQRTAAWIDIMVSGLRKLGIHVYQYRKHQATWTYAGRRFWARYRHPREMKPFGGIEVLVGDHVRSARVVGRIKSIHDAINFYNDCSDQAALDRTSPLRLSA